MTLVVTTECSRCQTHGPCTLQNAWDGPRWECRDGCERPYETTLSEDERQDR